MAAIATFFALAAPALRVWSVAEREAFLAIWAAAMVSTAGFSIGYCLLRLRAERRAGRVAFELPLVHARTMYFFAACLILAMLGLLVYMSLLQQRQAAMFLEMSKHGAATIFPSPLWSLPGGIQVGMPLAIAGTFLWWRAFRIELCEFGIVYFASFIPWSAAECHLAEGEPAVLTVRMNVERFAARKRATVPRELLPQVREMLDNRASLAYASRFPARAKQL